MISILLAVHNGEEYLREAIDSVLNQSFNEFELLIGLNDSTDGSREIIQEYNDYRITVFDYKEKGKAKTLNKLLKEANFEWIGLQDDDDIWDDCKLEVQMCNTEGEDVIGTKIFYINEFGDITGNPKLKLHYSQIVEYSFKGINQIANTSAIFKRKDAIEVDGWTEGLDGIEDFDFWLKLMIKGCLFTNLDYNGVYHRIHTKSNFNTKEHDIKGLLETYGL
jgi:glycosyltransferase involved in cell wall biosynthesis|tara:strand:- start:1520 stop:2182 length:663 start_codon:yes stop_codon:yes gene_type:complete